MPIHSMNLSQSQPTSYEQIVQLWKNASPVNVFDGHFLISFVANSSKLEGINISYNSTRELFESEHLRHYTGDLRDIFSVTNNKRVAKILNESLKERLPLSALLIKKIHRAVMFASIDMHRYEDNGERAGEFKKKDYCVGKFSVGAGPADVEDYIEELCAVCNSSSSSDPLRLATVFQCYFENIHPFADGNGRVGRWLTNYLLVLNNHPPVLFDADTRDDYFKALEEFDKAEDYNPMYNYLKGQVVKSWSAFRYML